MSTKREYSTMMEGLVENRKSCRHDAIRTSVYLGWWEDEEFRCSAAELKNVSQGGAYLELPIAPPYEEGLYLCMGDDNAAHWAEARVVATDQPSPGVHRLRLAFHEGCPYEMFTLAVYGVAPES